MIPVRNYELIRQSFDDARAVREFDRSPIFYSNFFKRAPDKRRMFREDLGGQGMKFISTMQIVIHALDSESKLDDAIGQLAKGHAALGVKRTDFDPMCDALIDTLMQVLNEKFTPEMETAWRDGFRVIARRMAEIGDMK